MLTIRHLLLLHLLPQCWLILLWQHQFATQQWWVLSVKWGFLTALTTMFQQKFAPLSLWWPPRLASFKLTQNALITTFWCRLSRPQGHPLTSKRSIAFLSRQKVQMEGRMLPYFHSPKIEPKIYIAWSMDSPRSQDSDLSNYRLEPGAPVV